MVTLAPASVISLGFCATNWSSGPSHHIYRREARSAQWRFSALRIMLHKHKHENSPSIGAGAIPKVVVCVGEEIVGNRADAEERASYMRYSRKHEACPI